MQSKLLAVTLCACTLFAIASGSAIRHKRGLTEDAEHVIKQSGPIDANNVSQLLDLVEKNNAETCLARVICDISQNARAYGDSGAKFAQSLLKFRQSKHPKVKQYTDAMAMGARAKNSEQCKSHYSRCTTNTAEVITVGNKILRSN